MNVVWFREVTGRDRDEAIESDVKSRRTWQAITDTAEGGPDQVLTYIEVPALGDFLQYTDETTGAPVLVTDTTLVVVRRRAEQNDADNLCNWLVTAEYGGADEPESQPAEVEYSPTRFQEAMLFDEDGVPVVNTAGDPFAEGVMRDRTRFTLQIVKNIAYEAWVPLDMAGYQDSLNLIAFMTFPPKTCKLTLSAKRMRKRGLNVWFWSRTATIEVNLNTWYAKVRNAGFRQFDAVAAKAVPILDEHTHHPPSAPQLLAVDGSVLPFGAAPEIANGPDGFKSYKVLDWTPLALEY